MNERNLQHANIVFVGGTAGIGHAAATALARRGASILVVGRDAVRGEAAANALRAAGARSADFSQQDVGSVAGIAQAATAIRNWRPALNGLVHSAMLVDLHRVDTVDGFERAFGLQYLARYALNRALVDLLAASGDGRIVHIGAKAPRGFMPDLDDLQFHRRKWTLLSALMSSQVLGYLHVQEAARRWHNLPVTATVACVSVTRTNSAMQMPWWIRSIYHLMGVAPERAALNTVRLLTASEVQAADGAVLYSPKRYQATRLAYDAALATRLWEDSEKLLSARGLTFDETNT